MDNISTVNKVLEVDRCHGICDSWRKNKIVATLRLRHISRKGAREVSEMRLRPILGVYYELYLQLKSRDYVSKLLIYNFLHKAWINF